MLTFRKILAAGMLIGVLGTPAFANDPIQRTNSTTLWFENWGALKNAKLVVVSPDGTRLDITNESSSPTFQLRDIKPVVDGVYSYELTAATDKMEKIKNPLNNGRGKAERTEKAVTFQTGGFFIVSRGVIAKKEDLVEE